MQSKDTADVNGTSSQATPSEAWWRTRSIVTRRSSGRRCGLERWRGNELNTELGARYSTRWLCSGCPIRTAPGDSATGTGRSAICSGPCNNAPFNQGWNDGAGNPPNPNGLKTDYLWKRILTRDGLTNILENYTQVVETKDEKTGKKRRKQIWPRYHQLNVVRRLLADTRRASSETPSDAYLRKVEEADFVIWLIGHETTQPVVDEVHACIAAGGRLLAFKLPATHRDETTRVLIDNAEKYSKWGASASKCWWLPRNPFSC